MEREPEFESRIVGPTDKKGVSIGPGDKVEIKFKDTLGGWARHWFGVEDSEHERLLKLVEDDESDEANPSRATAYFDKSKEMVFDLVPEALKGEEGQKFRRIVAALGAAAAAGVSAYIVIKHRKK